MTKDEAFKTLIGLHQQQETNHRAENEIERKYTALLERDRQPYRKARFEAMNKLDALRNDPKYIEHFCLFKPGDFVQYGQEWLEVIGAKLVVENGGDDDNLAIGVRLSAYEIRWNGERAAHATTMDQARVTKVPETADKRLLKRVKKRIIQRLEGGT